MRSPTHLTDNTPPHTSRYAPTQPLSKDQR